MNETNKRLAALLGIEEEVYRETVNRLVRERYSLSDELALLRRRDSAPEAFAAYDAFVEDCKARAALACGRAAG